MKTHTFIDLSYFEKILGNVNLINWLSEIFYLHLGVTPHITYSNDQFSCKFIQNKNEVNIIFTKNGRNELFHKDINSPNILYIQPNLIESLLQNRYLPDLGNSKLDWFFNEKGSNIININYDFPSLLIWYLNRIEEYGNQSNEKHGRYELINSKLKHNELYLKPVVDEWFLLIKRILESKKIKIIDHEFAFEVSHDVDVVSRYKSVPLQRLLPVILIDLFYRPRNIIQYLLKKKIFLINEKINTFDWIMSISERYNLTSKFYFIVGNTSLRYDYRYKIHSRFIKSLILKISKRGHEIGIHYSYNSSLKKRIKSEFNNLNCLLKKIEISPIKGGRMHYLRFNFLETLIQLEEIKQQYDNTITFHESGGFKCGTCRPFYPFNLFTLKKINVEIRPLIIMEGSVLGYSNIQNIDDAFIYFKKIIKSCNHVGGLFSMLWHNSDLETEKNKILYEKILKYCNDLKKQ
jgi:hypothetical protein